MRRVWHSLFGHPVQDWYFALRQPRDTALVQFNCASCGGWWQQVLPSYQPPSSDRP